MLGQEGQQHIHYAIPMWIMGYDYGTYKKQYDNNAKIIKQQRESQKMSIYQK